METSHCIDQKVDPSQIAKKFDSELGHQSLGTAFSLPLPPRQPAGAGLTASEHHHAPRTDDQDPQSPTIGTYSMDHERARVRHGVLDVRMRRYFGIPM